MKTNPIRIYRSRFHFLGTIIKQILHWYKKYYIFSCIKITNLQVPTINLCKSNFKVSWCILIKVFTKSSNIIRQEFT